LSISIIPSETRCAYLLSNFRLARISATFVLRPSARYRLRLARLVERTRIFSLRENAIALEPGLSYPECRLCASRLGASIGGSDSFEPSP